MEAYQTAISIAKSLNDWSIHPNKKRKDQFITLVEHLDPYWTSENLQNDVPIICSILIVKHGIKNVCIDPLITLCTFQI